MRRWQSRPRIPLQHPHGHNHAFFLEAIRRREIVHGHYHGKARRITPLMLYAAGPLDDDPNDDDRYSAIYDDGDPVGPYYLQVWDHDHAAERTYKADAFTPLPTAP